MSTESYHAAIEAAYTPIARVIAANISTAYGLENDEVRVAGAIQQFMYDDPDAARYWIGRAASDIGDQLGINDAPWDDEDWFARAPQVIL